MHGTALTGISPPPEGAAARVTRRLGIALAAGLLWPLTACSGTTAPAAPAAPQGPGHPIGRIVASADPSRAATVGKVPRGARCTAPPVIAHRGEGASIAPLPENTSVAELAAAKQGATLLNVDVRWTSDDVPVAIHDPTLNRTTTGAGPVASITAAQFIALGVRTNDGKRVLPGQHPQTLAQLLAAVRGTAVPIVIQMEADPFAGGAGRPSIDSLAAVVSASGYAGQVVVGGWAADDVSAFSTAAPGVRTAYIQESGNPTAASIRATGARILYIDYAKLTPAQITAWHAGGLTVWAWTPAYVAQWTKLRAMGVDAIATNWIANYRHWGRPCAVVLPPV